MIHTPPDSFVVACQRAGLNLQDLPIDRLGHYLERLLEVNASCNLTAVRDPEEAWMRHIFDSLTVLPLVQGAVGSWVDVGTGGGIPGMVLALVFPERPMHLIDATGKKCQFLKETAGELGAKNVVVHHLRAEEAGRKAALRGQFELCFSRAVSALNVLVELCVPLLGLEGRMLALKGEGFREEVDQAEAAIQLLGASPAMVHPVAHNRGAIIEIRKVEPTPDKYPRKPGMPNKRPLV